MFSILKFPLKKAHLEKALKNKKGGAIVTFEGVVRNHNERKEVVALEYEAAERLAKQEARKIFAEAKSKFNILNAKCVHRVGKLRVGELVVWVGVVAAHRQDAFQACRYIIDALKVRLPIWKKEYYAKGSSQWINCQQTFSAQQRPITKEEFYSKQVLLPELGKTGQAKLENARILVVGAGGLGSSALLYLAAAGVGTIGICEFDKLEASNLHRQIIFNHEDVGRPKVQLAAKRLKALNPFVKVNLHPQRLTADNAAQIIARYDCILDCTDNFPTKFLLNDAAVLQKKALIQSSIYQFEGQIHLYDPRRKTACLRCLWPQIPPENCTTPCTEAGVVGVVPGFFGVLQATEALKWILNLPDRLTNETLIFNLLTLTCRKIRKTPDPSCPVGRAALSQRRLNSWDYQTANSKTNLDISGMSQKDLKRHVFVDVRESSERKANPVPALNCLSLPFSRFGALNHSFDLNTKYLLFCEKGLRSQRAAEQLRNKDIQAFSLLYGVEALKDYLRKNS